MKQNSLTNNKAWLKTGISSVFCLFLNVAGATPLNISNDPLFISDSVAPGVFIMMDDSGSMDWEVLTRPFYKYEDYYDSNHDLQTHGRFNGYTSAGDCIGWTDDYAYMYDNGDNLYTSCTGYGATIEENPGAYNRDWRILSSDFNVMYYDPSETYKPWVAKDDDSSNASAQAFPDADFSNARSNPQPGEDGYSKLKDLDGFIYEVAETESYGYCDSTGPIGPENGVSHNRCSANSNCSSGICNKSKVDLWDTHTRYKIDGLTVNVDKIIYNFSNTSATQCPSKTAPTASVVDTCFGKQISSATKITNTTQVAEIKQNVANWYQYNRRRSLVAKSAVAAVLESSPFYRFGMGTLHDEFFTPLPVNNITNYIPHNQDLFNKFAEWNWQGQGTPLREGLEIAGEYFSGKRSGYTGTDRPIVHACQQNFTVLLTDGFYNGSMTGFGDKDSDSLSDTLADIAYYYYQTDLDSLFNNIVPTTTFDTQDQQHMVTFTVAFGVTGKLIDTDSDGWPNPALIEKDNWGNPFSSAYSPSKIDDMWHAAYNSRGAFISAKTPGSLVQGLNDALSAIQARVGSASSAAASTGASVLTETNVFFAFFDSNDWSGDLYAYDISTNVQTQVSNFNNSVKASVNFYNNTRSEFYSWNPSLNSVIDFDWSNLNLTQQSYLNDNPDSVALNDDLFGEKRLAFIKGDTSYDGIDVDPGTGLGDVTLFRDRVGKTFGDILNSAPQFVGGTFDSNGNPLAFINSDFSEAASYITFQTAHKNRDHMIYVGANDGMLHGLIVDSDPSTNRANSTSTTLSYLEDYGKETFAYVPSAVIKRLNKLTSSKYDNKGIASHRYLVDGSPIVEDAYDGSSWKTVLVSGLGAGGQGVFALDVTDGAATSSNNIVLWEFNDSDDADLGYSYSRPVVARLQDGNWYAIFGNGYNNTEANNMDYVPDTSVSTTGHAVLFLLKISGPTGANNRWVLGTDYYKLDTGKGDMITPNGLASISTLDFDRDQVVDAVYAGDLQGNLWRFDLLDGDSNINSGSFPSAVASNATKSTAEFRIAYGSSSPEPVFTTALNQPITSAPIITSHPIDGFMVVFGTGQYLESGDNQTSGLPTQSLYGIWDSCVLKGAVGNNNDYQINYKGKLIPSSSAACVSVTKSKLLQQEIVKEEIEIFTEAVDSNNDGVIDSNDTAKVKNTEEVRISTAYKLSLYDKAASPTNTQTTVGGTDQYGNTISYFTYVSETGWLNNAKDGIAHKGWHLDLIFNGNNKSERNTNKPLFLGGTVFFNTYTPSSTTSCGASGDTWIYALNASDGRQLAASAFDLNQDAKIDQQDEFNQSEVVSARKKSGYTPGGTLINAGKDKHSITFGGDINNTDDDIDDIFFKVREGRQTWRVIK